MSCARLNATIGALNKQHKHFVDEMREYDPWHEPYPSLPSPKFEISVYHNCESSFSLESNFVDNAPSTDPEETIDLSLTSLVFVAMSFSITPKYTTVGE